eukprot:GHVQ01005463.1.p1 GENE.GHVQ01005463.1~~GHVQ01005463.1.p1  ORF type:complete len:254 (+),score=29.57 GHVQ01005463.1:99-860(+)
MSHRKFERPRHGSLGFLPRKRCRRQSGKVKAFPKDDPSKPPHFTAFMGFKAGMTHIVREVDKPGSKLHKKEVVEAVTVVECPNMVVVGLVGYIETPRGLRALTSVWAGHLSDDCKRRFYKRWYKSKQKAFTKYTKKFLEKDRMEAEITRIKNYCQIVRAIVHSQPSKTSLKQKKAHIMEIQINGGSVSDKVCIRFLAVSRYCSSAVLSALVPVAVLAVVVTWLSTWDMQLTSMGALVLEMIESAVVSGPCGSR